MPKSGISERRGPHVRHTWNSLKLISAVPPRLSATQRYGSIYIVAAAIASSQVWRISGYDIDFTGVGGQPTGFDQCMALYQNYIVTAARYRAIGTNGSSETPNITVMWFSAQSGAPASIQAVLGQKNSSVSGQNGTGSPPGKQSGEVDVVGALATDLKSYRENPNFWGTASADPATVLYLHMYTVASNQSTALATTAHTVEIDLDIEFFNPVQLAAS